MVLIHIHKGCEPKCPSPRVGIRQDSSPVAPVAVRGRSLAAVRRSLARLERLRHRARVPAHVMLRSLPLAPVVLFVLVFHGLTCTSNAHTGRPLPTAVHPAASIAMHGGSTPSTSATPMSAASAAVSAFSDLAPFQARNGHLPAHDRSDGHGGLLLPACIALLVAGVADLIAGMLAAAVLGDVQLGAGVLSGWSVRAVRALARLPGGPVSLAELSVLRT
jgi:hypothetical protein